MRDFVRARPLVGSAMAALIVFAGFAGICLAAGENAADSVIVGAFLGVGTGSALALRYLIGRRQLRR
jgi:hypothetical protein